VPDPTLDENLELSSGRGVKLIQTFMDEVEYLDGGRRIRMLKIRS
jgi:serine/threonine-protein kinase RsbW